MALPNETLAAIFTQLTPHTLTAVARVDARFNAVAERILYSSIYITETLSNASPLPYRTLHWCEAMRRRAHLYDSARRLHIRWQAASPPTQPSPYLPSACDQLAAVLRRLPLLESLDIYLGPANAAPGPLHAVERAVRGCIFPHLRSCALGADAPKGSPQYTDALGAFLGALPPALRQLRLADLHGAPPGVPPYALSQLAAFRGCAAAAAALLPGRPVRALALVGDDADVTPEALAAVARTAGGLRTLDLSAMAARPLLLRNVSAALPELESLRIRLALRHTLHYALSGIRLLAGLSSVLSAFTQLAFLDLSPTGVDGVGRADAAEEHALCTEWARACPSLRRVVFPSQTEWLLAPPDAPHGPWTWRIVGEETRDMVGAT